MATADIGLTIDTAEPFTRLIRSDLQILAKAVKLSGGSLDSAQQMMHFRILKYI